MMQKYDNRHYKDADDLPFIVEQFTKDFVVKVDAHSNSPIFMEDSRSLAFNLFKAGALTKERLIDMVEPPLKQLIKEDAKKMSSEPQQQPAGGAQPAQPKESAPIQRVK